MRSKVIGAAIAVLAGSIGLGVYFKERLTEPRDIGGLLTLRTTIDGRRALPLADGVQAVIINYWATWCAPCIQETPSLFRLAALDSKIVLISISEDDGLKELKKFLSLYPTSQSSNVFVIHDLDRRLAKSMNVKSYPTSFIYSAKMDRGHQINGAVDWESKEIRDLIEKISAN